MSPILDPRDPSDFDLVMTSFRVTKQLRKDIDEIATQEHYSRNEVVTHFFKWAIEEHRRLKEEGKTKRVVVEVSLLPPKKPTLDPNPFNVTIPKKVKAELEKIAKSEARSRNEIGLSFLEKAVEQHWKDRGGRDN